MRQRDHPHGETDQCWKRDGYTVFAEDGISPLSIVGSPCRCRKWQRITQQGDESKGKPARTIEGCFYELFPWMVSGAIIKAGLAAAMTDNLRRDVQGMGEKIGGVERAVVGGLNRIGAAVVDGLGRLAGNEREAASALELLAADELQETLPRRQLGAGGGMARSEGGLQLDLATALTATVSTARVDAVLELSARRDLAGGQGVGCGTAHEDGDEGNDGGELEALHGVSPI